MFFLFISEGFLYSKGVHRVKRDSAVQCTSPDGYGWGTIAKHVFRTLGGPGWG